MPPNLYCVTRKQRWLSYCPYSSPVHCCTLRLFVYSFIISKAYFSCRDAHGKLLHSMHFPLKVLVHLSELDDL